MYKNEAKPQRLNKDDFLKYWRGLTPNQGVRPDPVPYKHEGSTYMEDGIRVTGSREFVDSVLSRFQDLLDFENAETRLDVNYSEQTGKAKDENGKPVFTGPNGRWVAYIKVAERGREAQIANAILGAYHGYGCPNTPGMF